MRVGLRLGAGEVGRAFGRGADRRDMDHAADARAHAGIEQRNGAVDLDATMSSRVPSSSTPTQLTTASMSASSGVQSSALVSLEKSAAIQRAKGCRRAASAIVRPAATSS